MEKNVENDEIIIDFNKIGKIIDSRKIIVIFFIFIALIAGYLFTKTQSKKFDTNAKIFINKSNDTNLSDINPFVLSDMGSGKISGGIAGLLSGGSNLSNEIDIMKSPLVMDKVIKENNLRYKKGPKKGKLLNTDSFVENDNLKITNLEDSKIIVISYRSTDPKQAYKIINSIVNNYKEVYETINSKKASSDREFLKKTYLQAKKDLDLKINNLKKLKSGSAAYTSSGLSGTLGLMGLYDKRLGKDLNEISQGSIDVKKIESELEQEFEKVKLLKEKLEWSNLVETMSRDVTNITILKEPEIKEPFEYSEPKLKVNLVLSIFISLIFSSLLIIGLEIRSKKQTFSDIDDNTIIANKNDIDLSNLQTKILINNIKDLTIVSLADSPKTEKYLGIIKRELANLNITLTDENSSLDQHIKNIMSSENIVFIGQLGYTERKPFNQLKDVCKELKKNVINTFLIV